MMKEIVINGLRDFCVIHNLNLSMRSRIVRKRENWDPWILEQVHLD